MDFSSFKRVLTAFADTPADIDAGKGTLVIQIRDELITANIISRIGAVYVIENEEEYSAEQWIVTRIAKLPTLADRILSFIPDEPRFLTPSGDVLDDLTSSPTDEDVFTHDAGEAVVKLLDRRPAGTASVVYLTSNAGEGKTTLISHLARRQAQSYKEKKTQWLLVPVPLGGRTFMRFDDVIAGALMNRLRFNLLYYDAFIELVRLGVVIPAFDGFEEMFVEGAAGDAMSALGSLVQALKSSGTMLIAARKAYFEFKNLHTQTRLFDSLGEESVTFTRVGIRKWDRNKFIQYCKLRKVADGEAIFDEVTAALGADHPLLTRAVLVRRLLDVAADAGDRHTLLHSIEGKPDDFFRQFVGTIIVREANEKWIDKKGEAASPLLTVNEHYELLSAIAYEMWINSTESLTGDVLDCVADIFSEARRKDKIISGQILERLKQHALLGHVEGKRFGFDHPEFYYFFLGEAIGQLLVKKERSDIRHALRQGTLPELTVEAIARNVIRNAPSHREVVTLVNELASAEPRTSFIKDNLGGIVSRLVDYSDGGEYTVAHCSFPEDALNGRRFSSITFEDCYFQRTALEHASFSKVKFVRCDFEHLGLGHITLVSDTSMTECKCHSVQSDGSLSTVYDPNTIPVLLRRAGFSLANPVVAAAEANVVTDVDSEIVIVDKILRTFRRRTDVTDTIIRRRLGAQAAAYEKSIYPVFKRLGILVEMPFGGGGTQQRFRLGIPSERLTEALEACGGRFDRFLELVERR